MNLTPKRYDDHSCHFYIKVPHPGSTTTVDCLSRAWCRTHHTSHPSMSVLCSVVDAEPLSSRRILIIVLGGCPGFILPSVAPRWQFSWHVARGASGSDRQGSGSVSANALQACQLGEVFIEGLVVQLMLKTIWQYHPVYLWFISMWQH